MLLSNACVRGRVEGQVGSLAGVCHLRCGHDAERDGCQAGRRSVCRVAVCIEVGQVKARPDAVVAARTELVGGR